MIPLAGWGRGETYLHLLRHPLLVGREEVEFVLIDIINALELLSLVDRPRQRTHLDLQFLFQFVQQVERVATFAVHLVDEDDDGRIPHAAHLHQLPRLRLHTLGTVHHDDGRVNSRQRTVSVFGKVLVSRCVEDVHLVFCLRALRRIVKFHHRRRYRDTSLFLDVHPVGCRCLPDFVTLHGTSHLYLSAKQQKLLCQRCLTGIRVRNNGERPPAFNFWIHVTYVFCGCKGTIKREKSKIYFSFSDT